MVLTSIFQGHYHTVFSLLSSAQGCEWIRLRGESEKKTKAKGKNEQVLPFGKQNGAHSV